MLAKPHPHDRVCISHICEGVASREILRVHLFVKFKGQSLKRHVEQAPEDYSIVSEKSLPENSE